MGRDMVSIKGTRNGLVIVLDPEREFEEIRNTLLSKMESAKGFFKGAKFSLFQGQQGIPVHQKDELENICRQYGLVPNAEEQAALRTDFAEEPRKTTVVPSQAETGEAALMVRRSLRSGQRISYPGHIIVMGDIHPGAEVVSGGNVLVLGVCQGVIHAGAGGDRSARVIAQRLAPTVLSIANRRVAPDRFHGVPAGCIMASLSGQEIVFEPYQSGK